MDCMEVLLGVKYFEIVILIADPSLNCLSCCTEPLPKVVCPKIRALLFCFKAAATISEAEAEPRFTKTTSGTWATVLYHLER